MRLVLLNSREYQQKWRVEREVTYGSRDLNEAALFQSVGLEEEFQWNEQQGESLTSLRNIKAMWLDYNEQGILDE